MTDMKQNEDENNCIELITKKIEEILTTGSGEFNIRKISIEVITFIFSITDNPDPDTLKELGGKTVQRILDSNQRKDVSGLSGSSDSDEDIDNMSIQEILLKLKCDCEQGRVCSDSMTSSKKKDIMLKEEYKARRRMKKDKKIPKLWKTAKEIQDKVEQSRTNKKIALAKKKLKKEERDNIPIMRKKLYTESNRSIEESVISAFEHLFEKMDNFKDTSEFDTSEDIDLYIDEHLMLYNFDDISPQERVTQEQPEIQKKKVDYAEIKIYATNFVTDILNYAEILASQRLAVEKKISVGTVISEVQPSISLELGQLELAIENFNPQSGQNLIDSFTKTWKHERAWTYCIDYISEQSDTSSDFHIYEVKWSLPTEKYPIPQATVSVYFTIEVSRILPQSQPVQVTYVFEGNSSVYKFGSVLKYEEFLEDILDCKIDLFKQIRF